MNAESLEFLIGLPLEAKLCILSPLMFFLILSPFIYHATARNTRRPKAREAQLRRRSRH